MEVAWVRVVTESIALGKIGAGRITYLRGGVGEGRMERERGVEEGRVGRRDVGASCVWVMNDRLGLRGAG